MCSSVITNDPGCTFFRLGSASYGSFVLQSTACACLALPQARYLNQNVVLCDIRIYDSKSESDISTGMLFVKGKKYVFYVHMVRPVDAKMG